MMMVWRSLESRVVTAVMNARVVMAVMNAPSIGANLLANSL